MSAHQIKAIYPGTCPDCGDQWQPGDPIRLGVGNEPGFWRHDVCPDPLATDHPVCQTCWLTHPEGACDR